MGGLAIVSSSLFFFSTLQAVDDYDTKITQKKKSLISKS